MSGATGATAVRDRFTADARAGVTYRVEEVRPEAGTIRVVPLVRRGGDPKEPSAGPPAEFRTNAQTEIWKGDKKATLAALEAGDEIRVNRGGVDATPCTDNLGRSRRSGGGNRPPAAALRRLRQGPRPARRVERTEGQTLTLSVFGGEPAASEQTWPGDSGRPGKGVRAAVANDELRTWNPPVDHEFGKIVEFDKDAAGRGVRLVVTVNNMLEGFRQGRYVRLFPDAWRPLDQPFGEQLFHYGARSFPAELAECPAKEYPGQYPFRTDYGNTDLPWYRLQPGAAPPADSEHRVFGELLAVDASHRSGRFRLENTTDGSCVPPDSGSQSPLSQRRRRPRRPSGGRALPIPPVPGRLRRVPPGEFRDGRGERPGAERGRMAHEVREPGRGEADRRAATAGRPE